MKKELLVKTLALGIVVLFISVSYQPIIAEKTTSVEKTSDYNNVDFEQAKHYLFQTIIDVSNNPMVKEFLNEHKHDLIINNNNNYDFKNAIQKIYSQNPRLLKSIFFTKPKMTYEYLETNYKRGLEIVDILGKEESLKMEESVKIVNPDLFNELKNIIANDEKLSNRVSVLKEMNNDLISTLNLEDFPDFRFPIFCTIFFIIVYPIIEIGFLIWALELWAKNNNHLLLATIFSLFFAIYEPPAHLIFTLFQVLCLFN